jgi:hypothetical protein
MPLSDIVLISIGVTGNQPTQQGFGVPLIASYHTVYPNRVRSYSSLAGVAADFASTTPTYKAASALFSQSPRPPIVKVGRRALAFTQGFTLTCLQATTGVVYSFSIAGHALTYTVPSGSPTTTTVATAITSLITALSVSGLTATSSGAVITIAATAGLLFDCLPDTVNMSFADTTADPGIATDLAAIVAEDPAWYLLLLDSQGDAEIEAAAAYAQAESPSIFFLYNTSDSACATSSSGDVMSTLKTDAYTKCAGLFSQTQLLSYSAAAWAGEMLPTQPGSENWAFKTLAGVPADNLTTAQIHYVEGKNASVYTTLAGINFTQFAKVPSGEWIDVERGLDWLSSTMSTDLLGLLLNNSKVPFTDPGISLIQSTISGRLQNAVDVGLLAANPKYVVTVPTAASVSPTDKGNRNLPNVTFTATLAGAINSVQVLGTVNL